MDGLKVLLGLLACVLLTSAFEATAEGDNYIVGGRNAQRGQFPWLVSLRTVQNKHFCGGYILSNRWIGTAAQCTRRHQAKPHNIIAVTGAHTRVDGVRNRIARIIIHPRNVPHRLIYDIAVLQTAVDIVFNALVRPVTLPTRRVVHDGTTVQLAGWGYTKHPRGPGQGVPAVLQWIETQTIDHDKCQRLHASRARMVHPISLCTYNRIGQGVCNGDGGSPLIQRVPNRPQEGIILGSLSWSLPCARGFPDVYAKFWPIIPFLRAATNNGVPNLPQGSR